MIEDIVLHLADIFPEYDWDIEEGHGQYQYVILVNDFDFYMKDAKFRKILKILRKKNPGVKFVCAYKKFSY